MNRLEQLALDKNWPGFLSEYILQQKINPNDKNAYDGAVKSATTLYVGYTSKPQTGTSNTSTTTTSQSGGLVGGLSSGLKAMGSTSTRYDSSYGGEQIGLEGGLSAMFDTTTGKLKSTREIFDSISSSIGNGILLQLRQQVQLQEEINTKTGMTGKLSEDFRSSITEAYPSAIRLGISFDEMSSAIADMTADMGRFRLLNSESMVDIAQTGKVYFDSIREAGMAANAFQNVSLGTKDAMMMVSKLGKSSLELGLNSKTTTKELVSNIDKLNQFGFNKGVEGLNQMVQKSLSLKMNMQSVFTVAEKVMSPEGALELAANLQAIGGAIGDFADPIKMLYDSTNNVEGLQDAMIGAAESLATYNSESGRMEVVGANLRRARDMANSLGMTLGELTNTAVNAAQRTSAATDLMAAGLTFDNEEDKEFLTNLAQMKDGKMVIEIPKDLQDRLGKTDVALETMSQSQRDEFLKYREDFKEMSTEDIAKKQVSLVENINRDVNFLATVGRIQAGATGETVAKALGLDSKKIMDESAKLATKGGETIIATGEFLQKELKDLSNMREREKATNKKESPMNVADAEKAKAETEKAKAQTQTANSAPKQTNIKLDITSDIGADEISRAVMKDPQMAGRYFDAIDSYTYSAGQ